MRPLARILAAALPVVFLIAVVGMTSWLECHGPDEERGLIPEELATDKCRGRDQGRRLTPKELATVTCEGNYKGIKLDSDRLDDVRRKHLAWLESGRTPGQGERANLCEAILVEANLEGANLGYANLQGANLRLANLKKADLQCAELQGANLWKAELQEANLWDAKLQRAYLVRANVHKADFGGTKLQEALYESDPDSLPSYWTMAAPSNHLDTLMFFYQPAALIALRDAFKKGGMRTQERQLTYAIERTKRRLNWDRRDVAKLYPGLEIPKVEKDPRPWREQLADKGQNLLNYMLFELPSCYGMAPGRTLCGLFVLTVIFTPFYWIAIKDAHAESHSGLWMIEPKDRIAPDRGEEKMVQIEPYPAQPGKERLKDECRMLWKSLYFSLLSAFHLGWREYNVGTWIARLQPREYTLRAAGWVRTVAGIQSLLSLYLLALWVLTYFGRPFE